MRDITTTVVGNVATAPKRCAEGTPSEGVMFRLAVTTRYFKRDTGTWENRKSEFFNVFARGPQAENVYDSVHVGEPVIVHGRLATSDWVREDGQAATSINLQADNIGHDLTFGTAKWRKREDERVRDGDDGDEVAVDRETGEVLGEEEPAAAERKAAEPAGAPF